MVQEQQVPREAGLTGEQLWDPIRGICSRIFQTKRYLTRTGISVKNTCFGNRNQPDQQIDHNAKVTSSPELFYNKIQKFAKQQPCMYCCSLFVKCTRKTRKKLQKGQTSNTCNDHLLIRALLQLRPRSHHAALVSSKGNSTPGKT